MEMQPLPSNKQAVSPPPQPPRSLLSSEAQKSLPVRSDRPNRLHMDGLPLPREHDVSAMATAPPMAMRAGGNIASPDSSNPAFPMEQHSATWFPDSLLSRRLQQAGGVTETSTSLSPSLLGQSAAANGKQLRRMRKLREEYRNRRIVRRLGKTAGQASTAGAWLRAFRVQQYWNLFAGRIRDRTWMQFLMTLDILVDLTMCTLAVYEIQTTDAIGESWWFVQRPDWLWISLVSLAAYNLVSFFFRLVLANNWRRMLFCPLSAVELLTTVPFLLSIFVPNGQYLDVPFFLRVWVANDRLKVLLNVRMEYGAVGSQLDPLTVRLTSLITTTIAFVFTWACLFHYTEMVFADMRYGIFDSLYVVTITATTVGYGDIAPKAQVTRLMMIFMIILAFAFFPRMINGVIETYRTRKEGQHSYIPGKHPFVTVFLSFSDDRYLMDIVTASLHAFTSKARFVTKRNHIRHQLHETPLQNLGITMTSYHIVLISTNSVSPTMKTLLSTRKYSNRFTLLHASALEESDLRRTGVRKSAACFILADRAKGALTDEGIEEDYRNVLRTWSVRKYAPRTPVYIHNLRPETDLHVRPLARQVICVTSIKQMILGLSCLHRGSASLITNLVHQAPALSKYSKSWQVLYSDGISNGIHLGPFNPLFTGRRFGELAWYLYAEFQAILIGLRFRVPAEINLSAGRSRGPATPERVYMYQDHLVLNPGQDYVIPSGDIVKECVFIAQSIDDVVDIEHLSKAEFELTWAKWMHREQAENPLPTVGISTLFAEDSIRGTGSCQCCKESPAPNPQATSSTHSSGILQNEAKHDNEEPKGEGKRKAASESDVALEPHEIETYFGHPRPPHHMVLDNDLQSPFCHMLRRPAKLQSAHIWDATRTEKSSPTTLHRQATKDEGHDPHPLHTGQCRRLEHHILVCSGNFELWTYICTMRASYIPVDKLQPILILCPQLPTDEDWRPLSVFPNVLFIQGNAMKRNDMIRAGLFSASCVVMMKHPTARKRALGGDERFVDSTAIMATHQIDFMVREKYVITELVTRNNIKFMRAKTEMLDHLPFVTSQSPLSTVPPLDITHTARKFAYRHTVPYGELGLVRGDATPIDADEEHDFWNRTSEEAVGSMDEEPAISTEDNGYYAHSAIFASGRVLAGDMFDGLVFEAFRSPGIVDVVKLLCGRRYQKWAELNQHLGITASILCSVPLPARFQGQSFSQLFHHLAVSHGMVPIAIYRQRTEHFLKSRPTVASAMKSPQNSIPLRRTMTSMSAASVGSGNHHLFDLESNGPYLASRDPLGVNMLHSGQQFTVSGTNGVETLVQLLEDSQSVDNDLPFVITNPLPDFTLDAMDLIFVLKPTK